jgi:phenylalanyl-tRNA synthetase beta chain
VLVSYRWVCELLDGWSGDPEEMRRDLTFSGTEIERAEPREGDVVFEANVTSNRADELCHLGIAREVAAVRGLALRAPAAALSESGPPSRAAISARVEAPDLAPRLTVRVIEGLRVGPSPEWLRSRLEAIGVRTVNNVVDVTNYVMWELGQPLHAFDLARVRGGLLQARRACAGESLRLLNGQTIRLDPEDLVIADAEGPLGLAGIMGGAESEVMASTTAVALESAHFQPATIRRSARRHQLRSDASHRFERRTDRAGALAASARAASLLQELCGGRARPEPHDLGGPGPEPEPICLRPDRPARVAGSAIAAAEVRRRLESLGLSVSFEGDLFLVRPPTYRSDLVREIDLVEEVIRLGPPGEIPERHRLPARAPAPHPGRALRRDVRDRLARMGCVEVMTVDFVSPAAAEFAFLLFGPPLLVRNPVRAGEPALRRSLLPGLLQVNRQNADRGTAGVAIFEVGRLHAGATAGDAGPVEVGALGLLRDGELRDLRGIVDGLLAALGVDAELAPASWPGLARGAAGRFLAGGRSVGVLGRVDAETARLAGLRTAPAYAELDLDRLGAMRGPVQSFAEPSRFPAMQRDLAVVVSEDTPFATLASRIAALRLPDFTGLDLFDLYRGPQVGEGRKSLNIRLTFQSSAGTLTSAAVDAAVSAVIRDLEDRLGALVRKG